MRDSDREALAEGHRAGSRAALVAPRRAPQGVLGAQLGRLSGSSIEFMDHRAYHPGDDPRRVDWAAYARTHRLSVKLHQEEVSPHADILIDGSASMALPGSAKARATLALAAAFVAAAENAQMTHAAWFVREQVEQIPGGTRSPQAWQTPELDADRNVAEAVLASPPVFRRRSVRLFLSDLLFPADPSPLLARLSADAAGLTVVQLLARDDAEPTARGNVRLADAETGETRDVFIDAVAQQRYRQRLQDHRATWDGACRRVGATLVVLIAEDVLAGWDLRLLFEAGVLEPA